ncbi:hypothetical protein HEK616_32830 [Streptomyces nigrescens]|uniref:Uncharacterized protein n=1 Tax=Streptomyces nigrescens TaxID=1920 RepID=A0ABM7ZTW3_STRNI|nr:hypothetical protein HEK616_32830 [Streptomyces nigrescens]
MQAGPLPDPDRGRLHAGRPSGTPAPPRPVPLPESDAYRAQESRWPLPPSTGRPYTDGTPVPHLSSSALFDGEHSEAHDLPPSFRVDVFVTERHSVVDVFATGRHSVAELSVTIGLLAQLRRDPYTLGPGSGRLQI